MDIWVDGYIHGLTLRKSFIDIQLCVWI
jgi:hypothetical protein